METKSTYIFHPLAEGVACGKALLLAMATARNNDNAEQWRKALHAAYVGIQSACDAYMTALRSLITDNDQRARARFIQCEAAFEAANAAARETLGRDACYTAPVGGDMTIPELFKALSSVEDNGARAGQIGKDVQRQRNLEPANDTA